MSNSADHYLNEYSTRKRLAKLGYTSDLSQLSSLKANAFMIIESEIDSLREEQRKRK